MRKILVLALAITFAFAGSAFAQNLPSYYPKDGFQRTGQVDAVYAGEFRIVIDDIPYQYSKSVIVHSLTAYRSSLGRIHSGVRVAFRTSSGGRVIEEIWLLPRNFERRGTR